MLFRSFSTGGFFKDFKEIKLNKEIPVAIMVYDSDNSMENYSLESYFSPDVFKDMDLVQAITLTFSDKDE